jgi:hypothetical protein
MLCHLKQFLVRQKSNLLCRCFYSSASQDESERSIDSRAHRNGDCVNQIMRLNDRRGGTERSATC